MPRGPLIGRLRAGHEVTLPDGQVIKPEQVTVAKDESEFEKPNILVVEVISEENLKSLAYSQLLSVSG